MKNKFIYIIAILTLTLTTSCSKEKSHKNDDDNYVDPDEQFRLNYVSTNNIYINDTITMGQITSYCDSRLEENDWPNIRKYSLDNVGSMSDIASVLYSYNATYCYLYRNALTDQNRNLLFDSRLYIFPENNTFMVSYDSYSYDAINLDFAYYSYTDRYFGTFDFHLGDQFNDVIFAGRADHTTIEAYSFDMARSYWAYAFDISNVVLPSEIELFKDSSYDYALIDSSNPNESYKNSDIAGDASRVYGSINKGLGFTTAFFTHIISNYQFFIEK